jgi:hypothetical protein
MTDENRINSLQSKTIPVKERARPMNRFEYEVLTLQRHGKEGRDHTWFSDRDGLIGGHNELTVGLNCRGARGWHVVAYASDGRFGNTLLLQRQITDGPAVELAIATPAAGNDPAPITASFEPYAAAATQAMQQMIEQQRQMQVSLSLVEQKIQQAPPAHDTMHCEIVSGLNAITDTLTALLERPAVSHLEVDPSLASTLQMQTRVLQELLSRSALSTPDTEVQPTWMDKLQTWIAQTFRPAWGFPSRSGAVERLLN